jgi:hypothetical protein
LKDLTASKLAALNFGSVVSMLPGQEATQVVTKVKEWRGEFGEITVGGQGGDPIITLQLSGIDLDSVLVHVQTEDTAANRRGQIRKLLIELIEARTTGAIGSDYTLSHVWRGQSHDVDVVFGNVRDATRLPVDALEAADGRWRLVIDFPFDDEDRPPADDLERVYQLKDERVESDTVFWLPHFVTHARMDEVGKLVTLDYLLTGNRFDQYSSALPVADREPARRQLANQRDSLREQVIGALRQAYGIDAAAEDQLGARVPDGRVFATLAKGYDPLKPSASTLRGAVEGVLGGGLDARYPQHPVIDRGDTEVKRAELTAVLELAREAMLGGSRIEAVDRARAGRVRRVVDGFSVGKLREVTYALQPQFFRWHDDFTKAAVGGDVTVAALRAALVEYGMTTDVQDLLVLAWAAMTDRVVRWHGSAVSPMPAIGELRPEMTLHEPVLPETSEWTIALERAKRLFGLGGDEYHLSSAAVDRLGSSVGQRCRERRADVELLVQRLEEHTSVLGLADSDPRLDGARRARDLVVLLVGSSSSLDLVRALAEFDLPQEVEPFAHGIESAGDVAATLGGANWDLIGRLSELGEGGLTALETLQSTARRYQRHDPLRPALVAAAKTATDLLVVVDRPEPKKRTADEIEAERRAEEARRRAADELAAKQRELAEEQARLRQQQEELDRQRQAAERELERQREQAARERAEREKQAAQTHSIQVDNVVQAEDLAHELAKQLARPVAGKKLRVTWRWE